MSDPSAKLIAVAVVLRGDHVLIGRRPPGVPLAGLWEFPGGKVQPGETPAAAAVRECQEETGLAVEVMHEYTSVTHDYPHGRVELRFFQAAPLVGAQSPRAPFRWVSLADLNRYEFPPANAALLTELRTTVAERDGQATKPQETRP